jgi:hypothetical protein
MDEAIVREPSTTAKDVDQINEAVENDLKYLQRAIATMSQICLDRVVKTSQQIQDMESDVNAIDGMLTFIKDSSGVVCHADLPTNCSLLSPKTRIIRQRRTRNLANPIIEPPGLGYVINMEVLNNIGYEITDQPSQKAYPRLIRPVTRSQRRTEPRPWTRIFDFFVAQNGLPSECERTTVEELYRNSQSM